MEWNWFNHISCNIAYIHVDNKCVLSVILLSWIVDFLMWKNIFPGVWSATSGHFDSRIKKANRDVLSPWWLDDSRSVSLFAIVYEFVRLHLSLEPHPAVVRHCHLSPPCGAGRFLLAALFRPYLFFFFSILVLFTYFLIDVSIRRRGASRSIWREWGNIQGFRWLVQPARVPELGNDSEGSGSFGWSRKLKGLSVYFLLTAWFYWSIMKTCEKAGTMIRGTWVLHRTCNDICGNMSPLTSQLSVGQSRHDIRSVAGSKCLADVNIFWWHIKARTRVLWGVQ
jgi:hypothetical protein